MKERKQMCRLAESLNLAHIRQIDEEISRLKSRLEVLERLKAEREAITLKGSINEIVQSQIGVAGHKINLRGRPQI